MKRRIRIGLPALLVLAALAAAACNDSGNPIFYTISREEPVADNSLPNEATVMGLAEAPAGRLFAAAGKVYYRDNPGTDWTALAPPAAGLLANSVALHGGELYVGFNSSGLYRLAAPGASPAWDRVNVDPALQTGEVTLLKEANSVLFVGLKTGTTTYALYNFDNPGTPLVSGAPEAFNDVVWDGSEYIAARTSTVRSGTSAAAAFDDPVAAPSLGTGITIGGLLYSAGAGGTLLSTSNGSLYLYTVSWSSPVTRSGASFNKLFELGSTIFVGTRQNGYYKFTAASFPSITWTGPDYNSVISNAAVEGFFESSWADLFAYTSGSGVFRSSDAGASWDRE